MKINEIIEGNKLIAEFMGWDRYGTGVYHTPFENASFCNGEPTHIVNFPQDLKFNSSWDWLMPVVEKIENSGFDVNVKGISCSINRILETKTIIQFVCGERSKKIELVWLVVVEFIKWYNKNK